MALTPTPPSLGLTVTEFSRAARETGRAFRSFRRLARRYRCDCPGRTILVLPGYGGADGSTALLRRFLDAAGHQAFALELGRNIEASEARIKSVDDATRFREQMTAATVARIEHIARQTGSKVTLIGWSMGGLYAVDASREIPEKVEQVITLGSPFGDPRGTSLFSLMRRLSGSTVPIESQNFSAWLDRASVAVPTDVIFSRKDGIVGTAIAQVAASELVRYREVDSSHIAFTHNPLAFEAIAECLTA